MKKETVNICNFYIAPPLPSQENGTSTATRSMIEALQNVVLRRREPSSETPMSTMKKLNTPKAPYYDEIIDTINSKKEIMLRRKLSNRGKMISKSSSVAEIQQWLNEKNFSKRYLTNKVQILVNRIRKILE
jgi:hypothetical protein